MHARSHARRKAHGTTSALNDAFALLVCKIPIEASVVNFRIVGHTEVSGDAFSSRDSSQLGGDLFPPPPVLERSWELVWNTR